MKQFLVITGLAFFVVACSKDKFETKPQLSLKSITEFVPLNGTFNAVFEYTDKEGDVQDTIFMRKVRTNLIVRPPLRDSIPFQIPQFPNNQKGEITLNVPYQNIIGTQTAPSKPSEPTGKESDTLSLRFWIKDRAGNKSDTLVVNNIVVQRGQ